MRLQSNLNVIWKIEFIIRAPILLNLLKSLNMSTHFIEKKQQQKNKTKHKLHWFFFYWQNNAF